MDVNKRPGSCCDGLLLKWQCWQLHKQVHDSSGSLHVIVSRNNAFVNLFTDVLFETRKYFDLFSTTMMNFHIWICKKKDGCF